MAFVGGVVNVVLLEFREAILVCNGKLVGCFILCFNRCNHSSAFKLTMPNPRWYELVRIERRGKTIHIYIRTILLCLLWKPLKSNIKLPPKKRWKDLLMHLLQKQNQCSRTKLDKMRAACQMQVAFYFLALPPTSVNRMVPPCRQHSPGCLGSVFVKHTMIPGLGNFRPMAILSIMISSNEVKIKSPPDVSILYDLYAPVVYGFILGIIADEKEAEIVLSKIFSRLSAQIEGYEHRDKLLLWLIHLSRNECIARLIRENSRAKGAAVNDYVQTLPLLEKTIFSLVYFKGLEVEEVANLLQLPVSRIQGVFTGLPKFTPYLFKNMKSVRSPISDMLQSLVHDIIPENDAERVAALKRYEILYTPAEEEFDKIMAVIARVFEAPMSFLSLVDEDTVFYKSQVGPFGKAQVHRKDSLCSLTILSREPLIIEDASLEGCFKDNPFVQAEGGIKFYAGAPLITSDGYLIGALCIVDTRPRKFSSKDTLLLTEFAAMAMQEIETRHATFQQALLVEQLKTATKWIGVCEDQF